MSLIDVRHGQVVTRALDDNIRLYEIWSIRVDPGAFSNISMRYHNLRDERMLAPVEGIVFGGTPDNFGQFNEIHACFLRLLATE